MNYLYATDLTRYKNEVHTQDGIQFVVEPKSWLQIVGTEMHYDQSELSREFTFKNPNAKNQCGCGESFNLN